MGRIQEFARKNLVWVLLTAIAVGFALTTWELVLYRHWEGTQLIGFVATVLGAVLALAGIFVSGALRNIVAILLVLLSITGLIGTYEHFEHAPGREGEEGARPALTVANAAQAGTVQNVAFNPNGEVQSAPAQEDDADEQPPAGARPPFEGGFRMPPPPLAPLSLTGLALMAAIVVLAKPDRREVAERAPAAPASTAR